MAEYIWVCEIYGEKGAYKLVSLSRYKERAISDKEEAELRLGPNQTAKIRQIKVSKAKK